MKTKTLDPENFEPEIIFKGTHSYSEQPKTSIELKTNAVTLDEIFIVFKEFLLGMGFYIDGDIDIIKEDKDQ